MTSDNTKYILHLIWLILFLNVRCISAPPAELFEAYDQTIVPFEFNNPDKVMELDEDLDEISGLTYVEPGKLAAIEDEDGDLYFISTGDGRIMDTFKFDGHGDYEAIAYRSPHFFVMKSNGDIFRFTTEMDEDDIDDEETEFSSDNDIEGLTFNGNSLLVACKGSGDIDGSSVKGKAVYSMNAETFDVNEDPFITITEDEIEEVAKRQDEDIHINDFDPSAIAVDPVTKQIYLLSADHILVVFNADADIEEVVLLNREIYPQPEGLCFDPDGNLYMSSEASGKKARLFLLKRRE